MSRNELVKIYNLLQDELHKAPPEDETLSEIEIDLYADMQNLKETLTNYFVNEMIYNKKSFEYTECHMIGLNKYLYVFDNNDEFKKAREKLSKIGTVQEVFFNNEWGLEFKENKVLMNENIVPFSELSQRDIEYNLTNCLEIPVTIGDENVEQIKNEMGELGAELYEKYYDWYAENGMYEIYDFIDSFCYGKIDEIKSYLDEVIEFTNKNEKNILEMKNTIYEIEADKEQLDIFQKQREESHEIE